MVRINTPFSTTQVMIVQNKVYEINPSRPEKFFAEYETDNLAEQGVPRYFVKGIDEVGDTFGMLTHTCVENELREFLTNIYTIMAHGQLQNITYKSAIVYDLHVIYMGYDGAVAEEVLNFDN